jgi:HTH-type transcriptional regulator/antitoxin HipB
LRNKLDLSLKGIKMKVSSKEISMQSIARSPKQFSEAIKRRRKELGITQMELAEKTGLSQKTVSKLETGVSGVRLQTLFDVLAVLNLEIQLQTRTQSAKKIEDIF